MDSQNASNTVFEMRKKGEVWIYENRYSYRNDSNTAPGSVDWTSNYSYSVLYVFDELGDVDFDKAQAIVQGRYSRGRTDAARAKGVRPDTEVRRPSFLRDTLEEHRDELRVKLRDLIGRML